MQLKMWRRVVIGGGLLLAIWAGPEVAQGQEQVVGKLNPNPKKEVPREFILDVSRQKLPNPLFKYRLLPLSTTLNPGNAAPVYLRLDQQMHSDSLKQINTQEAEWQDLPLADFPQVEARKLVETWSGKLQQLEFGTRREHCDWDYTFLEEKDNPFTILLPDAQGMGTWARLLEVKSRLEIVTGQTEQAIHTLETGIAFGRHLASGPFIINKLIGIRIIGTMLDHLDELIGQPGTPNLYWALTALPLPLVDMGAAIEIERVVIGRSLTGHTLDEIDLNRPRTDAEWSTFLADLHVRMIRMEKFLEASSGTAPVTIADLAGFKTAMLPQARDYLKAHNLTTTSDDQALAVTIISLYRELTDENFKFAYTPYPDAVQRQTEVTQLLQTAKSGPAAICVQLIPNVQAALLAEVRLARKVAILRVVEALRLYAADHDGELPITIDQIKAVPIPLDPLTGQAFPYRLENATAILEAPMQIPQYHLIYRITIRK